MRGDDELRPFAAALAQGDHIAFAVERRIVETEFVKALQVEFRPGVLLEWRRRDFRDPPLFRERARVVGFDLLQRLRDRGVCQQRLERRLGGARQFLGAAIACRRQCYGEAEQGEGRRAFHIGQLRSHDRHYPTPLAVIAQTQPPSTT